MNHDLRDGASTESSTSSTFEAHNQRIAEERLYAKKLEQGAHVICPASNGSCAYVIGEAYGVVAEALALGRSPDESQLQHIFSPEYYVVRSKA